jgi:hypothetical protein
MYHKKHNKTKEPVHVVLTFVNINYEQIIFIINNILFFGFYADHSLDPSEIEDFAQ